MVTTPQFLATMVVNKAVQMARSLNVPVIGIIENMAGFWAEDTGRQDDIFGPSHSQEVAKLAGAPALAQLPLRSNLAALCDAGMLETAEVPEISPLVKALETVSSNAVALNIQS